MADALKDQGNKAFAAKDYDAAIDLFTQAIALDSKNHVLYSNRSAAKAGKKLWIEALEDAEECIRVNPAWSKGYARKGAALHGARRWDDAIAAYQAGLKIENTPALQKGLKEVQDAKEADEMDSGADSIGKMFTDPGLFAKLAANPKTAPLLADQAFVQKLKLMQTNPKLAATALQDPRMISVLGVLMGIDMQGFERPEGSDELPAGLSRADAPAPAPAAAPKQPPPPPPAADTKTAEPDEPAEPDEDAIAKKQAEEEKKRGTDAYKKRDFVTAADAFAKAWDLSPKDITYLTNLAAAQFEQGEYDKAIVTCEKAVEEGRSLRSDYKMIAKALGREGNAYAKKSDFANAIKYLNKSLTEHRTPEILNKLREVEKLKAEADKQAYVDPALAEKAREEGNTLFKAAKFAEAVGSYTEAIKRNPGDARGYNNRAAAYTKLAALPEALKDAEEAIKVDPTFVKGYIRKSLVLFAMREYNKAMQAAQEASDADADKKHTAEIEQQLSKVAQAMYTQRAGETEDETLQRAMRDPEVASIMTDPVMNQILQQAQQDPASLQDHMKNPIVRSKIQKLVAAGIIKTR